MPARLTAYLPDDAAPSRLLQPRETLCIGRGDDCGLRLNHPSVSRRHAELQGSDEGWRLLDLGSKNGSFADGAAATDILLRSVCWLRFGDIYCEFTPLTQAQAAESEQRLRSRRVTATAHTRRMEHITDLDELLSASVRAAVELAQCERGFLLLRDGDDYAVRASHGSEPQATSAAAFPGSAGVLRRATDERRAVIVNDVGAEPWLAGRASVVSGGLRALVCLPLLDGDEVLGALYADRGDAPDASAITTLDLELLGAFVERAALWIAARRASQVLCSRPVRGTAEIP